MVHPNREGGVTIEQIAADFGGSIAVELIFGV
jgi:hypothetical protein